MPFSGLSTAKVARMAGVHPNTVRLYEQIGWIEPVPRSRSGYRLFRPEHVDEMRLARIAFSEPYPGPIIRRSAVEVVRHSGRGETGAALEQAYNHLAVVQSERAQAEAAARLLERWADGSPADSVPQPLRISRAAAWLRISPDRIRNWERSGLVHPPREPGSGYRIYGPAELGRLRVIRMLREAGYSLMAILRMISALDAGSPGDLRAHLDTPRPDEDAVSAADRWLSTLAEHEKRAGEMITLLESMLQRQTLQLKTRPVR